MKLSKKLFKIAWLAFALIIGCSKQEEGPRIAPIIVIPENTEPVLESIEILPPSDISDYQRICSRRLSRIVEIPERPEEFVRIHDRSCSVFYDGYSYSMHIARYSAWAEPLIETP